jgi:hypothetical protein
MIMGGSVAYAPSLTAWSKNKNPVVTRNPYPRRQRGLGQATDWSSYMKACMGQYWGVVCAPTDDPCIANQTNVQDACQNQFLTDPNSPHNTTTPTGTPTAIWGTPAYTAQLAAAGGSIQLQDVSAGEQLPASWWTVPGATVTAAPLPANYYTNPPKVVNPSPGTQKTDGTTAGQSSASTQSQANGTTAPPSQTTVNGQTPASSGELIPGVSNWLLAAGAVLIGALLMNVGHK